MAIKRIDENPSVTDQIIFDLITTDISGCVADPYAITQIDIYFLERSFVDNTAEQEYDLNVHRNDLLSQYAATQAAYCQTPTEDLQTQLLVLQNQLASSVQTFTFYYKNAISAATFGDSTNSVWVNCL